MKIVIAGRADERGLADLRAAHPEVEFVAARGAELSTAIADADAVYIHTMTSELVADARRLRWVQSQGAGVEWIHDVPELIESDVVLTNTRGAHAQTIAEHAFGLLLSLTRCLPQLRANQRAHRWGRPEGATMVGLSGLTFGVVGLGRIGTAIAQRAHGFDMHVVAVDANDVPRPDYVERFWPLDGLGELLAAADVVAVSTPLTPQTQGMIGASELAGMKPGAYLLVVSRGGIVDEEAVVAALQDGRLAGAGIDVTAREPLPADSPLWDAPNLLLTPHTSGASRQTTALAWTIFAENVGRFVHGQELANVVDKRLGY